MDLIRRHRLLAAVVGAAILAAAAVPVVAYVVVPAFVKRELVEDLPLPTATAAATAALAASPTAASSPAGTVAAPEIVTLLQGMLVRINAVDYGSGTVKIVQVGGDRYVRFENVDIAGAPDMYVYLSDQGDGKPGTFVDLGKLKATNGSFNHAIPASADLGAVRSVVIWCRQFSVTVTYALMPR